ncbi:hypothetical protein BDZ91DRAFT_767389 [Kalaharituber pfeilii]|nr:hypothetical protein BDZ91DRAFT_767389 [Kalaharituber pfeilii]
MEITRTVVEVDVTFHEYGNTMKAVWVVGLMGFQVQQRENDKKGEKKLKGETNRVWTDSSPHRGMGESTNLQYEHYIEFQASTNVQRSPYESVLSPKVGWWMYEKHPAYVLWEFAMLRFCYGVYIDVVEVRV